MVFEEAAGGRMGARVMRQDVPRTLQLHKVRTRPFLGLIGHLDQSVGRPVVDAFAAQQPAVWRVDKDPPAGARTADLTTGEPHALFDKALTRDVAAMQACAKEIDF